MSVHFRWSCLILSTAARRHAKNAALGPGRLPILWRAVPCRAVVSGAFGARGAVARCCVGVAGQLSYGAARLWSFCLRRLRLQPHRRPLN